MLTGKRRNDYDVSFRRSVRQLTKESLSTSEIVEDVDEMIVHYFEDTGEIPSDSYLELMADAILNEDLSDTSPDKATNTEYPILGERQLRSRRRIEVPLNVDFVDALYLKYRDPTIYTLFPFAKRDRGPARKAPSRSISQSWAMAIKERDEFRCQTPSCRSRNGIMHAHHIHNYADYPELRDELSNGVTLCESCHTEFRSVFGKRNNDEKELREFFAELPI